MAIFLIDYENVNQTGMDGADLLAAGDMLYLFYSESCKYIRAESLGMISESGCGFHAIKLQGKGANALDFYVAAQAGECFAAGIREVAIISKDKGYKAVRSFISLQHPGANVITAGSIIEAFAKMNQAEERVRAAEARGRLEKKDLDIECEKLNYRQTVAGKIKKMFIGTSFEAEMEKIIEIVLDTDDKGTKYRRCLHDFGRTAGTEIYRILQSAG